MRRTALLTLLLVIFVAFPALGESQKVRPGSVTPTYWSPYPPPKPLRFVDGHWTPYTAPDPSRFAEGVKIHTIAPGDTLWMLANQFYGDNLLWPFVWENNAWITDPHWIYPGDPLMVPPLVIIPKGDLERVEEFEAPDIGEVFLPAGSLSDMYCSFYMAKDDFYNWDTYLIGSDDPWRVGHSTYDIMYINKGREEGIVAGQEFTVLGWERRMTHPVTTAWMGDVVRMLGVVRVICTQEHTSTVVVTESCGALEPGMRLRPWEERPSPLRPIEVDAENHCVEEFPYGRGHIVYLDFNQLVVGTWDRVAIDLGSEHGVLPGDTFIVFRDEQNDDLRTEFEKYGTFMLNSYNNRKYRMSTDQAEEIWSHAMPDPRRWNHFDKNAGIRRIKEIKQPRRVIGELVVLATEPETSTAILTSARREIQRGDKIELKPGQPVN